MPLDFSTSSNLFILIDLAEWGRQTVTFHLGWFAVMHPHIEWRAGEGEVLTFDTTMQHNTFTRKSLFLCLHAGDSRDQHLSVFGLPIHPSHAFKHDITGMPNSLRQFFQIWQTCPLRLNDQLITLWLSVVKGESYCDCIIFWMWYHRHCLKFSTNMHLGSRIKCLDFDSQRWTPVCRILVYPLSQKCQEGILLNLAQTST